MEWKCSINEKELYVKSIRKLGGITAQSLKIHNAITIDNKSHPTIGNIQKQLQQF